MLWTLLHDFWLLGLQNGGTLKRIHLHDLWLTECWVEVLIEFIDLFLSLRNHRQHINMSSAIQLLVSLPLTLNFFLGASLSHTESRHSRRLRSIRGAAMTTPSQYVKCVFIGCGVLHHHLLQLCLSNTPWSTSGCSAKEIPAGIFTPRHPTRGSICPNLKSSP